MTWEDPPPRENTDWDAIGRELMTRPGQFKIVATFSTANSAAVSAYQIRSGHEKKKALNALGKFHAEAHTVDGEYRVYARYIGDAGSEATPNDLLVGPGSTSPEPGPPADACRDLPPSTTPGECPAHGFHPHAHRGLPMRCLDCPACAAESTKDGTAGCTAICGREPEGEHAHDCPNREA